MDVKILYVVSTIILSFVSIVLVMNYRKKPQNNAIKFLTYFIVLHFIGFVLFILRNQIPDFISIVIANTLFAIGTISLYLTIKSLLNIEPILQKRYLIPLVTYFIGFIVFTYISYDTKTRILIYYLFCAIYLLSTGWLLWRNKSFEYNLFDKITSVMFFAISSILIWIILQVSFMTLHSYYFSNSNIFMILSIFIINILSFWSLFALRYRIKN